MKKKLYLIQDHINLISKVLQFEKNEPLGRIVVLINFDKYKIYILFMYTKFYYANKYFYEFSTAKFNLIIVLEQ